MNYKLIALDIDGTILNSAEELSPRTRRAILRVQEQGIVVVLATGRTLSRTLPWADALGLKQPLIVHNGAVIFDQSTQKTVVQQAIDLQVAQRLLEKLEAASINYVVYTGESEGERIVAPKNSWREPENLLIRYLGESAEFIETVTLEEAPVRISIIDRPEKIDPFYEELKTEYAGQINAMLFGAERAQWRGIELIPANCSKGTGLASVAKQLGIGAAEVIAMGDNINDLEMITWAGLGIAMQNGSQLIRSHAKRIAPSHDQDGVAVILEELFL